MLVAASSFLLVIQILPKYLNLFKIITGCFQSQLIVPMKSQRCCAFESVQILYLSAMVSTLLSRIHRSLLLTWHKEKLAPRCWEWWYRTRRRERLKTGSCQLEDPRADSSEIGSPLHFPTLHYPQPGSHPYTPGSQRSGKNTTTTPISYLFKCTVRRLTGAVVTWD